MVRLKKWPGVIGQHRIGNRHCSARGRGGEAEHGQPRAGGTEQESGEDAGIKESGLRSMVIFLHRAGQKRLSAGGDGWKVSNQQWSSYLEAKTVAYRDQNNEDQGLFSDKLVFKLSLLRRGILTRKSARSNEL